MAAEVLAESLGRPAETRLVSTFPGRAGGSDRSGAVHGQQPGDANAGVLGAGGIGGAGDLRWCINQANLLPGPDQINFNIPGAGAKVINLTTDLPEITESVVIDGGTQPGFVTTPIVELNGGALTGTDAGLRISAGATTIRSLVIRNFPMDGIDISGPGNDHIESNFIGTNVLGTAAALNGAMGIKITDSSDNVIGGNWTGTGNLISGNGTNGIEIDGLNAQRNQVSRNEIGTDFTGLYEIPNQGDGIELLGGARNNMIGGMIGVLVGPQGNLISGNGTNGIELTQPTTLANTIVGNLIGTDAIGSFRIGNHADGVLIDQGAAANNIGMNRTMGAYNIISGNGGNGVHIQDSGSTLNNVRGNIIGLGSDGDIIIPNGSVLVLGDGVRIEDGSSNTIGGDATMGQGNVISGNTGNGVYIVGLSPNSAVQNKILGNFIGTDATGTKTAHGNGGNGIVVSATQHTFIGVVGGPADRNIISGNALVGIDITSGAVDTQVHGNYIGTDKGGDVAVGNLHGGITVEGSSTGTQIGGALGANNTLGAASNLISGNKKVGASSGNGIFLEHTSSLTIIQGNFIGTDRTGLKPVGNDGDGVYVEVNSMSNIIGGAVANLGNVISANGRVGLDLCGTNTLFDFNIVGLNADPMNPALLRNGGVWLVNTGPGNTDGGHNRHQ